MLQDTLNNEVFSEKRWNELREEVKFNRIEEPEKEVKNNTNSGSGFSALGTIMKYVIIVAAIAIIVFILFKLISSTSFKINKKIKSGMEAHTIKEIEDDLENADLDLHLQKAMEAGELKLVLRIYYLMIIKELSLKNWIKWQKNKTNGEYLYEMINRPEYGTFNKLTLQFEKIWYGEQAENKATLEGNIQLFKSFFDGLKNNQFEK